jgi:16S rRNA C967 or C1407 C5-methylase (RsmB/RsmF family)
LTAAAPKHEAVKRFHAWLLEHTERGNIDRQEAVSMLPVLFLGVRQGDRVLDMCASPGSKTTQALDLLLHASAASTTAFTTASTTSQGGLVVANDLDKSRAYMLVHRLTRNTLRHAVVTCGPGDAFPGLYAPSAGVEPPQLRTTNVFDRVLCDVPCSGDGTLRKNQSLWKEWHIGQGLTLHPTQLALALRGAALLRVGGVMVYSTCSFNPVENEAVVAELVRRSDGALELLDVSQRLEQLITREGRTKWKLGWRSKSKSTNKGHLFRRGTIDADDSAEVAEQPPQEMLHDWFERYEHVPTDLRGSRVLRSMFPPAESSEVAASLRKTLRLIPIDQNSGGFFVAVLRKVSDLPGENQAGLPAMPEDDQVPPPADYVCKLCNASGHFLKNCALYVPENEFAVVNPPKPKKQRVESAEGVDKKPKKGKKEKKRETLYRPVGDDVWHLIRQFYGISDDSVKVSGAACTDQCRGCELVRH